MTNVKQLSGRRIGILLRNELWGNYKTLIITAGAIAGLLLIINVASVSTAAQWDFNQVFFPITYLITGMIATSLTFSSMHNKEKGYSYLLQPASHLEKCISKIILTTIGYTVIIIAGYFLFSLLAAGITSLFFGTAHGVFNPFTREVWQYVGMYIVAQSIVLFSASFFKKLSLLKLILSVNGLALVLALVAALSVRLMFWKFFGGFGLDVSSEFFNSLSFTTGYDNLVGFGKGLYTGLKIFGCYIMPPFFWFLTYLRIREKEVM